MVVTPIADEQEWRDAAAGCPYATFFHTPEWFTACRAAAPCWRQDGRIFRFEDGTAAVFPFLSRRLSADREFIRSGPAGTYGGWLSKSILPSDQQHRIFEFFASSRHTVVWRMNPFASLHLSPSLPLRPDQTIALRLESEFASLAGSWSRHHQRCIRKAEKNGIQIRRASGESDWREYFRCYQDSLRRWGSSATNRYAWDIFSALSRSPSPVVQLWLAEKEGQLEAGALCFSFNRHTVYWHGAAYEAALADSPAHLLMHEIIRDACDRGEAWFDFNPSGGHEGVERFKMGFGGQALSSPVLDTRKRTLRQRILHAITSRVVGSRWSEGRT